MKIANHSATRLDLTAQICLSNKLTVTLNHVTCLHEKDNIDDIFILQCLLFSMQILQLISTKVLMLIRKIRCSIFTCNKVGEQPAVVAEWSNVRRNSCQVLYGMRQVPGSNPARDYDIDQSESEVACH